MNTLRYTLLAAPVLLLCAAALYPQPARAAQISDAANDFLATYLGPHGADLDVLNAEVTYNGSLFQFSSTSNGNIGSTAGGFFVWGINRGAGTARFGALASGVLFDSVVILTPGGVSSVRDLISNVSTNLDPGAVVFSGSTLTAQVSASLLPTRGFAASAYTVNLWPRLAGGTDQIADFAPDNANAQVTSTPEPASAALLGSALVGIGLVIRKRGAR